MTQLLKRDKFTTRRTKEDIEGNEQFFFKNKNVIAVLVNQSTLNWKEMKFLVEC